MRELCSERIERGAEAAPCKCGGYAGKCENNPTKDEVKAYDCGRPWACCTVAYKCRLCGTEFIAKQQAPDY